MPASIATVGTGWLSILNYAAGVNIRTGVNSAVAAAMAAIATAAAGDEFTLYFPPGTYLMDDTISWGDVAPHFLFAKGAKIITTGLGAKPLFKSLTGKTAERQTFWTDPKVVGPNADNAETFLELADANSREKPTIDRPNITGFRRVFNVSAGLAGLLPTQRIRVNGGKIVPPGAGSVLAVTPNASGSYTFQTSIYFMNVTLCDESDGAKGWTVDFDGDWIAHGGRIVLVGANKIDGLTVTKFDIYGTSAGGATLEAKGSNGDSNDGIAESTLYKITLKLSASVWRVHGLNCFGGASLQDNSVGTRVTDFFSDASVAVGLDILAGADGGCYSGTFGDHATAAIRTAATYGKFKGCHFASTGAHKTFLETGGADKSLGSGCTGISTGGGVTLVGANSQFWAGGALSTGPGIDNLG